MGVPYTGRVPLASRCARTKHGEELLGVPQDSGAKLRDLLRRVRRSSDQAVSNSRLFIKPAEEEASYGISWTPLGNDEAFEERVRFIHERMNQAALAKSTLTEGNYVTFSVRSPSRLSFP